MQAVKLGKWYLLEAEAVAEPEVAVGPEPVPGVRVGPGGVPESGMSKSCLLSLVSLSSGPGSGPRSADLALLPEFGP